MAWMTLDSIPGMCKRFLQHVQVGSGARNGVVAVLYLRVNVSMQGSDH